MFILRCFCVLLFLFFICSILCIPNIENIVYAFCLRRHVHNVKLFIFWLRNKNHQFKYYKGKFFCFHSLVKKKTERAGEKSTVLIKLALILGTLRRRKCRRGRWRCWWYRIEATTKKKCLTSIKAFARDHHPVCTVQLTLYTFLLLVGAGCDAHSSIFFPFAHQDWIQMLDICA